MFRSQLLWRLYAGYVVIIVIFTLIVGTLVSRQVTENGLAEIHQSLAVRSEFLAEIAKQALQDDLAARTDELRSEDNHKQSTVKASGESLQETLLRLGKDTASRLTVIAGDGRVVADSKEFPENMNNHAQRPEIIESSSVGSSTISRYSQTLQQQMVYRAQVVVDDDKAIGFVRSSLPLTTIDQKLAQLRLVVLFAAIIAALAALLLGLYFAKRFSDPLSKMTEIAEAISQGDYDKRISVSRRDEIGQLADAFNRMAKSSLLRMEEITNERNRLAMIFAGMVEGVIAVDQQQKIVHINQAAGKLLGLAMPHCMNQLIWEQVRIQEINTALEQAMQTQEVVKRQFRRPTEGEDLLVDIYVAVLRNVADETIGAVVVLHDISELDRLERVRRDFVANASHELKTPITVIRGLAETILDDEHMDAGIRHSFTEKIHAQSIRLSKLVTDLMTLSRLESVQGEQDSQLIDLGEVVRRSINSFRQVCQDKQLTMKLELASDKQVLVPGDIQGISQLVDNLIDNAVKYTPAGGLVRISLVSSKDSAELVVEDSGIGIGYQYQQRVFERFYRVDKARSRELGGTGLGLSIVKNIAEQHAGSVSLKSEPGVGSTFTVILPL